MRALFCTYNQPIIPSESPQKIVAEIPGGIDEKVEVSIWSGDHLASNSVHFRVDTEPPAYRVLAFGGSLVGPWSTHPQKLDALLNQGLAASVVIHEGKAGERLAEGTARLETVIAFHPGVNYLYVLEGANDLRDGVDTALDDMVSALDKMMEIAGAHNIHPILLTLPPRLGQALLHDRMSPTTEEWNAVIRSYGLEHGIDVVGLYGVFMEEPNWEWFLNSSGLHLNQQGQAFVAQVLYDALLEILR